MCVYVCACVCEREYSKVVCYELFGERGRERECVCMCVCACERESTVKLCVMNYLFRLYSSTATLCHNFHSVTMYT